MKKSTVFIFFVCVFSLIFVFSGCGRTPSRLLGKDHRQVLKVSHMKEFINISFDKRETSTVKDVTFLADDGYIYTREFKDMHVFQGVIRWVPYDHSDSLIQSRAISRWVGGAVNLKMPEDCQKVLGVDIGYNSESERIKNFYYLSTDGNIYSKEYREGFIDRKFSGWLEIRGKE